MRSCSVFAAAAAAVTSAGLVVGVLPNIAEARVRAPEDGEGPSKTKGWQRGGPPKASKASSKDGDGSDDDDDRGGRGPSRRKTTPPPLRLCALEEHVGFAGSWDKFRNPKPPLEWYQNEAKLLDLDEGRIDERIEAMDRNGVDYMILSMTGGTQDIRNATAAAELVAGWNDRLMAGVKGREDRLGWFCILPMFDPEAAIAQLRSCAENGAAGALVNGYSTTGMPPGQYNYYDDEDTYGDFWNLVEDLDIKVYLHPREMEDRPFFDDFPELRGSPWGFSMETAEHMLRLILSGFFDRHPRASVILGHNGEMLAYWAWRIDHRLSRQGWRPGQEPSMATRENGLHMRLHNVTHYLRNNVYATTSGMFDTPGFRHALAVMGPDRLMFSIDTAYETIDQAATWFRSEAVAAGGDVDSEVARKVACGNAMRIFQKGIPSGG